MYKEDWSRLIAILIKTIIVCFFGGLFIKLVMGMSGAIDSEARFAAIGCFLLAVMCALVIAIVLAPSLTEKCSDSFFNLLYPQPKKVSKTYGRARTYLVNEKYPEAIEEYRKAWEEDPDDVNAILQIADIYNHKLKDYKKAIPEYEKALAMRIDDNQWVFVRNQLADIYAQPLKQPRKAIAQLKEIIAKFPQTKYAQQAGERIKRLPSF